MWFKIFFLRIHKVRIHMNIYYENEYAKYLYLKVDIRDTN